MGRRSIDVSYSSLKGTSIDLVLICREDRLLTRGMYLENWKPFKNQASKFIESSYRPLKNTEQQKQSKPISFHTIL